MRRILACLFVLATWSAPAFATDFPVTKLADTSDGVCDADCSLREAIVAANLSAGADKVILGSGLTYTLSLGALSVTDTLTIDGHGSTVNGGGLDRVFSIQGSFLVTINDLTITNGVASGLLSLGGGLNIRDAAVVLNNCIVTGNSTAIESGARDDGGGIAAVGTFDATIPATTLASLTLNNSTISNNTGSNGGGIVCVLCTLAISNSTIGGNTATGGDGGGVDMVGNASSLTMTSSTVSSNIVSGGLVRGGGLSVPFGTSTSTLTRDRIAANTGTVGSAIFNGAGTISAADNWWGCNFGPGVGGAACAGTPNGIAGFATPATYLVLKGSTTPTAITPGQSSTMTADLTHNSLNTDTSAGGTLLDGTLVSFSGTLGSFASPTVPTTGGKASDVYTSSTGGTASLNTTLDGQTVTVPLTIDSPPTITAIGDQVTNEDTPTAAVPFTVGDPETPAGSLILTGTSTNTTLVPNAGANITFGGSGAARTVTITPAADQSGTATITVTVSDGTLTASSAFLMTVNAVNDPPTLNAIPDPAAILEDAGAQTVNLSGISAGGGESQTLTVAATSSNTALIPSPTVTYTSPNATGSLSYTPVANANGSAIVTVTVTETSGGSLSLSRTFTVNVTSVNDPPTLDAISDPAAILEDAGAQTVNLSGITAGGGETQTLTVTATSSNTALIPNPTVTYTSPNATGSLGYTPVANANGSAIVTVTVTDGGGGTNTFSRTFTVTVTSANDLPTISAIADQQVPVNDHLVIPFTVGDVETAPSALTIIASSSNQLVVPDSGLVVSSGGASRTLTVTPASNQSGTATITVTVMDGDGGMATRTFVATVLPGLSIADAAMIEGNGGSANLSFTVSLTGPSASTVTVNYATRQRTAIEGVDYLGHTGTVSFAPGVTTATILVPVIGDTTLEIDETFFVELSGAAGGVVITDAQAVGTITNDDLIPDRSAEFVTWGRRTGVTTDGGSVTKTASIGWTAAASSTKALKTGDGSFEFSASATDQLYIVGVSRSISPFLVITDIEFGIELFADATFAVVEHGVNKTGSLGPYAAGDRFAIALSGGVLAYQRNGVTFYTSGGAPLYPLQVDAALFTPGATIADVVLAGRLAQIAGTAGDFDDDGKTDLTVFRPSTGGWLTLKSSMDYTTSTSLSWGLSTDVPVAGDYDGDGKTDPAIFRPSTGGWYILKSSTNYTTSIGVLWGLSTDTPVPADYDGDGKTDPAVYRASTGGWYILKSSTSYASSFGVVWGLTTDLPVPGDYDGDGQADPAIFRPSTGLWAILKSSTGYGTSMTVSWGMSTDVAVPGDYDGDGKIDPAVFRPSNGGWYILKSSTSYTTSLGLVWGLSTDIPVPADYDGDKKVDPAIFRPSTGGWHVLKSSSNYTTSLGILWGLSTDVPINKRP